MTAAHGYRAKAVAQALPMPDAAPVTSATLPSNRPAMGHLLPAQDDRPGRAPVQAATSGHYRCPMNGGKPVAADAVVQERGGRSPHFLRSSLAKSSSSLLVLLTGNLAEGVPFIEDVDGRIRRVDLPISPPPGPEPA